MLFLAKPFAKKSNKGAETSIYLCSSPAVKNISGEYFVDCTVEKVSEAANDPIQAEKLWEISVEVAGRDLQR